MKKVAIILLLFSCTIGNAQKNRVKSLDDLYLLVNTLMTNKTVDKIEFLYLADPTFGKLYAEVPASSSIRDSLIKIDEGILLLNVALDDALKNPEKEVTLKLQQAIDINERRFPKLNFSGYNKARLYLTQRWDALLLSNKQAQDVAAKNLEIEKATTDSIWRQYQAQNALRDSMQALSDLNAKHYQDSILTVDRKKWENECILKFGKKAGLKVSKGNIELGMTREMVEYAWGSMYSDSWRTTFKGGHAEILYYKDQRAYLTIQNNRLVAITD